MAGPPRELGVRGTQPLTASPDAREPSDPSGRGRDLARAFFERTGATYDRVVAVTTLGLDAVWKRRLLAHVPSGARRVLDLACGTGILTGAIRVRHPDAEVVGVDLTAGYLDVARRRFASDPRVRLIHAPAEEAELDGTFDVVVSSYLPKYVDAARLLEHLAPHLAPGAVVAVHDFTLPRGRVAGWIWASHMRLLATAGWRVAPEWRPAFDRELEALIRRTRWTREFVRALRDREFGSVTVEELTWRCASIVAARRP